MKQEEKINYLRIAAGICGFSIPNKELDLLVSLYELVLEKQGDSTIHDIVDTEEIVKKRNIKEIANGRRKKN